MKSTFVRRAMTVGVAAALLIAAAACAKSQKPEAADSVPPPRPAPVVTPGADDSTYHFAPRQASKPEKVVA